MKSIAALIVLIFLTSLAFFGACAGPSHAAPSFDQCSTMGPCPSAGPEDVGPLTINDTFRTYLDYAPDGGVLPTEICGIFWTIAYNSAVLDHVADGLVMPGLEIAHICTTAAATPPPGCPSCNAEISCQLFDTNDNGVPPGINGSSEVYIEWRAMADGQSFNQGAGTDPTPNALEVQWGLTPGICSNVTATDRVDTDITVTVPEPGRAAGLTTGGLLLVLLVRRKMR